MKNVLSKKFLVMILSLMLIQCSSKKLVEPKDWCNDLYIPGSSFYAEEQWKSYEMPPVLEASSVVPANMIYSKNYTIDPSVYSDGFADHFQITTDWGTYRVAGTWRLENKINEINAIVALKGVSGGRAAARGLGKGIVGLVTAPYHLVKSATAKKENLDFQKTEEASTEAPEDIKRKVRDDGTYEGVEEKSSKDAQGSSFAGSLTSYNDNVLAIQKKYNLDANTEDEVLRSEVERVASLEATGGFITSMLPATQAVNLVKTIAGESRNKRAIDLYASQDAQISQVEDTLKDIGIDEPTIKAFQNSKGFTTRSRTLVTNHISYMDGVQNRIELIKTCIPVTDAESAWNITNMYSYFPYVYDKEGLARVVKGAKLPMFVTKDNRIIIVFAGDHIYWTSTIAGLMGQIRSVISKEINAPREIKLYVASSPSDKFINSVSSFGWKVAVLKKQF